MLIGRTRVVSVFAAITLALWFTASFARTQGRPADADRPTVRAVIALTTDLEALRERASEPGTAFGSGEVTVRTMRPEDAAAWIARLAVGGRDGYDSAWPGLPQYLHYEGAQPRAPAPTSVTAELAAGEARTLQLNWPDDDPLYYLEADEADRYRRVRLADRQGYTATARASADRDGALVDLVLTRTVLAGGTYDGSIRAVVGRPTLAKSVCTTSIPVRAGAATVLTWPRPQGTDPLARVYLTRPVTDPRSASPLSTVPGVVMVFTAQGGGAPELVEPLSGTGPFAVPPTGVIPGPVGWLPRGAPVEVACRLIEVPLRSAEWPQIPATEELGAALERLVADGDASVVASPRVIVPGGETAWLKLSSDGTRPAALRPDLALTPYVLADGRISVVLQFAYQEFLDKVDGAGYGASSAVTRVSAVRLELPDGGTGVVGGVLRMTRAPAPDGQQAREPVEMFAAVTARATRAQAATGVTVAQAAVGQPDVPPQPEPFGVRVAYADPTVDQNFIAVVAEVIAVAKTAMEKLFPERHLQSGQGLDALGPLLQLPLAEPAGATRTAGGDRAAGERADEILLYVAPSRVDYHENVATDRRNGIYVRAGRLGIGELVRPDASPVAILCEAVAELYNPPQLPGFNRFVTHRYLAPRVYEELWVDLLEDHRKAPLAPDGEELLDAITSEEYTPVHPDCAAVAALVFLEERLGLEDFRDLLDAVPDDAPNPMEVLRAEATKRDQALGRAFAAYDEALRLEPDEAGSCLVTSFEPGETVQLAEHMPSVADSFLFRLATDNQWFLTDARATDGTQSLCVQADQEAPWMALYFNDPDWKFRDWRRFSELHLDLMVEATDRVGVSVAAQDHPSCGHGGLGVFARVVEPGGWTHVSFAIDEDSLTGGQDMDAMYFSGAFRADSVSRLYIGIGKPRELTRLYLDNIRLMTREPGE